tara:strand:+ start:980 stop:1510 length:531 start_codon:yes stop_codon:yes gene_type:complete
MRKIACAIIFTLLGTLCFGCGDGYPKETNKLTYQCEPGAPYSVIVIKKIATKETSAAATGKSFDQAAYYEWKRGVGDTFDFTRAEFDSFTDSGYGQITSGPLAQCDPTRLDNYVKPTPKPTTVPTPTIEPEPTPTRTPVEPRYRIGAICNDGTRSSATGRGACSWHGGVREWLYNR